MMDLKEWLKSKMGDEWDDDLTTSENVTTLVEEVQQFRKLMRTLRIFITDLHDWAYEYDELWGEDDGTEDVHDEPEVAGTSKGSKR